MSDKKQPLELWMVRRGLEQSESGRIALERVDRLREILRLFCDIDSHVLPIYLRTIQNMAREELRRL